MVRLTVLLVFIGFSLQSFGAVSAISRLPANIVGPTDDRGMVKDIGQMYFSKREIDQIRNNVGYVYCPGNGKPTRSGITDDYLGPLLGTGFFVSTNVIVTAAHILTNMNGVRRPKLEKCFFQTMGNTPTQYDLVLFNMEIGLPKGSGDFAVVQVKLKEGSKQVQKIRPFYISTSPTIRVEELIFPILVSRPDGVKKKGDVRHEPLMQECKIRRLFQGNADRATAFNADCDSEIGGSGGPILARVGDELVVKGISVKAGTSRFNYLPYSDPPDPSDTWDTRNNQKEPQSSIFPQSSVYSYSRALHIDSIFLDAVDKVIRIAAKDIAPTSKSPAPIIGSTLAGAKAVVPSETRSQATGNFSNGFLR
jgi:hypothetical protein